MIKRVYIDRRHEHLAKKVASGSELYTCYCGAHQNEKAELAAYERQVVALERETMTPMERLKSNFASMSQMDRELFLDSLTNRGI